MPLYESVCGGCGASFEVRLSFNQSREGLKCPECGSTQLYPVFSGITVLQGSSNGAPACNPVSGCCPLPGNWAR